MNGAFSSATSHATAQGLGYNVYPGLSHPLGGGGPTQMGGGPGLGAHRNGLGGNSAMGGLGGLGASSPPSYTKLPNGYPGDKNDVPQLSTSFNSHPAGDAHTAFKPVPKRV